MAILAECPRCHKKQAGKNRKCSCGEDLVKAKKSQRVRYWIAYRVEGKQRREAVGYSIEEARDADGKRRVQKREHRIFEMLPEAKMTFQELTDWYLELPAVKKLASWDRLQGCLANFNEIFGSRVVNTIKTEDLESYQAKRAEDGRAPATIDMELTEAKAVINKAFENDKVDGRILKVFKRVKGVLKAGANARERSLTIGEYLSLVENAPQDLKGMIVAAFHTGMRAGEIRGLQWSWIDRAAGFIRIPAEATKEKRAKSVPINRYVKAVLDSVPRALYHDYVFTFRGGPRGKDFRKGVKKACKKGGIVYGQKVAEGFRFHDIRATFDTNIDSAGVSESRRKAILGHSQRGMDRHYLRPKDAELREAMDRFTAWFDAQIASVDQNVDQAGNGVS
jgi:integrase